MQPRAGGFFINVRDGRQDLIVNVGPHHVSTHGLIRYVLALDGETITDMDIEIGYHHRSVEKIGERQTWHQFIPYTDRWDYLAPIANNMTYVTGVEKLMGVEIPETMQGKSLVPLIMDQPVEWRDDFFTEQLMDIQNYPRSESVRTRDWKYIRYFKRTEDPAQTGSVGQDVLA